METRQSALKIYIDLDIIDVFWNKYRLYRLIILYYYIYNLSEKYFISEGGNRESVRPTKSQENLTPMNTFVMISQYLLFLLQGIIGRDDAFSGQGNLNTHGLLETTLTVW